MTIGSFVTSALGMQAQSHALQQISTNVANVSTTGYKKVNARFETLMSVYNDNGSAFNYFSANNVDSRTVDRAGEPIITGNLYDLSLNGRGFFIVQGEHQTFYTRAGDFSTSSDTPPGAAPQTVTYYRPTDGGGTITQSKVASYFKNGSNCYVMGWNYNAEREAFSSSLEPVIITPPDYYPGHETTRMAVKGNIPADATDTQMLKFGVYDTDFKQHGLVTKWSRVENTNSWSVELSLQDGGAVTSGPIEVQFDEMARMIKPTDSVSVSVDWGNGRTGEIALDLTKMTQYASALNGTVYDQSGKGFGALTGTSWTNEGVLIASYSNGASLPVCKIAVAQVQVPNSMEAVSGTMFAYTPEAGNLEIVDLQETLTETTISGGILESANVSLEEEFTDLVTCQRAYSGSVNAFTTTNEMTQEAIRILT